MYNKALLSVFKVRLGDLREKDTAVERCEVAIQDQADKTECRIIVKMVCRHGVTKTYKLTYEAAKVEHALFNHHGAKNRWRIGANVLRSFIDYFGANTEQLDIYAEDGRAAFTSYTEKIVNGKEILKHPLETSIALDTLDFEEFSVEEKMHIAVSVRDFKAIVLHAETLKASVQARYSFPTRPLQLVYNEHGMQCEFTLMTIGDYRGSSTTPIPVSSRNSPALPQDSRPPRPSSTQETQASITRANDKDSAAMAPPSQPASRSFQQFPQTKSPNRSLPRKELNQKLSKPSPPPPKASLDPESLFLPADTDDKQWDEANYEEEETLGWDASASSDLSRSRKTQGNSNTSRYQSAPAWPEDIGQHIAPTQRLDDVDVWP
ncbi:MAG: hypothetical protein LQ343_001035 [Gyalolechia ehrenbergii]|nr:MAG: hypothetical protein LQ343_001035 [Gyalolechia ehrenbergii]